MQQVTCTYAGAGMDGHTDPHKLPVTAAMGPGKDPANEEVVGHNHASEEPSQAPTLQKGVCVMPAIRAGWEI